MKSARAFSLSGEFERVVKAKDIALAERHNHKFLCLDPGCQAEFHWRAGYSRRENTERVKPTFVHKTDSAHKDHCPYDYINVASRHQEVAFFKNGKFHLRINFPMGSRWGDRHPHQGRITRHQLERAEQNKGTLSVNGVKAMTKLLEKEFTSLQSEALDNLVLEYQGVSYPWRTIYFDPEHYSDVLKVAKAPTDDPRPSLIVVQIDKEIALSERGKHRYSCAPSMARTGAKSLRPLQPILVFETSELAGSVKPGETLMVAARPFVPDHMLRPGPHQPARLPVYLHIADEKQMTKVNPEYGRPLMWKQLYLWGTVKSFAEGQSPRPAQP